MAHSTQIDLTYAALSARVGRWWFQRRSFSPIPLFLLMVLLPSNFNPTAICYSLAVLGILVAEAIRIWAVGYAGSRTRTRGDTVVELVHVGPYRYVRNPLYIANVLLYTGCGLFFGFSYLSGFIFLYSLIQYSFIIAYEEEVLQQTFGEAYLRYRQSVPRWIPNLGKLYPPSSHVFDLRRALRSERSTFFSMAAMAVIFTLKKVFLK